MTQYEGLLQWDIPDLHLYRNLNFLRILVTLLTARVIQQLAAF